MLITPQERVAIERARQHLNGDYTLSVFIVRDLDITKALELDEMAWAMYRGECVRSEAVWLVSELEKEVSEAATRLAGEPDPRCWAEGLTESSLCSSTITPTNKSQTIRIWIKTLKNLRMLYALTGKSMMSILDELVAQELERILQERP